MKKQLITLLGLLVVATAIPVMADDDMAATAQKPKAPHYMSLEEAQAAAKADGRNVIIDFYTDWCTWCHRFDTVNMVDQKTIDFFTNEMALAEVNAEVDTVLAKKFGIIGYPTFVLLDANGEEIDRVPGYLETDEYIQTMRDYKKGIGTLAALVDSAKTDNSRSLAYEIAEKYKYKGSSDDAELWYKQVIAVNAKDSLGGESKLAIADMYQRKKMYDKAIPMYKTIAQEFAGTPFEENADIWTAIVYRKAADTANAIAAFEAFAKKYPNSEDFEYAQKQIEKLKGTTAADDK